MEQQEILKELKELKALAKLQKRVLTLPDVALLTGLSHSHLYKKTCDGTIPYYRNNGGKLLFFDREEIENWCLKYRHATKDEVEASAATYCATGKASKGRRVKHV